MELMIFAGAALVKIAMVMIVVLLTVAFLTLAERKVLSWMQDRMGPMEVGPYGILYILAFASIGAYGIILGGWASNNKYSLLGGLRAAAQVISYELNIGLAIIGVIILSGSLSMVKIAEGQAGGFWHWYLFGGLQI